MPIPQVAVVPRSPRLVRSIRYCFDTNAPMAGAAAGHIERLRAEAALCEQRARKLCMACAQLLDTARGESGCYPAVGGRGQNGFASRLAEATLGTAVVCASQ